MRLRCHCHPPTTPHNSSPSVYCLHINSCGNRLRTCEDTSNQARAFPRTSESTHQSNIAILDAIAVPLPSTDNTIQFLTIRLLLPLQFSWKLLKNLRRYIQSSTSLPSHLLKYITTYISGVPGEGSEERVNAAPVVVGTGARPGHITVHLGITSDDLATESTQLAGRGGCARRK